MKRRAEPEPAESPGPIDAVMVPYCLWLQAGLLKRRGLRQALGRLAGSLGRFFLEGALERRLELGEAMAKARRYVPKMLHVASLYQAGCRCDAPALENLAQEILRFREVMRGGPARGRARRAAEQAAKAAGAAVVELSLWAREMRGRQ